MFKNIRNKITSVATVALLIVIPLAVPAMAGATSDTNTYIGGNLCQGASLDLTASGGASTCSNATTTNGTTKVNTIVHDIINIFSLIVGIVSVIMIIVGGFRYITSGGASDSVSSAKNTIIYAIVGLVVVALAQFIVQFVLNKVTQ